MSNTTTPAGQFTDQHDNDFVYTTTGDGLFTVESATEGFATVLDGHELDEAGIELTALTQDEAEQARRAIEDNTPLTTEAQARDYIAKAAARR